AVILQNLVGNLDPRHHANDQCQLSGEVVLHAYRSPRILQHLLYAPHGKRPNLVEVQVVDTQPVLLEEETRLVDRTVGRAPPDQGEVRGLRAFEQRIPDVVGGEIELAHPFVHLEPAHLRFFYRLAVLIVLVTRGEDDGIFVARHRARRDARLG